MTNPIQLKQTISERIISLRKQAGWTQTQVAKALDINRPAYQAYEEGRALPPLNVLMDLKVLYGLKRLDDLTGSGNYVNSLESAFYIAEPNIKKAIKYLLKVDY